MYLLLIQVMVYLGSSTTTKRVMTGIVAVLTLTVNVGMTLKIDFMTAIKDPAYLILWLAVGLHFLRVYDWKYGIKFDDENGVDGGKKE